MLFLDADALSKLAHWNILPVLPQLLGIPWDQVATISSLRYRAMGAVSKPDKKLFHTSEAAQIAVDFIAKMATCPSPSAEVVEAFSKVPQIDAGEAVLFSLVMAHSGSRLLTGDKRALRALAKHELAANFDGKIICVEQILKLALDMHGREWLISCVGPQAQIDKAAAIILGSRHDAPIEHIHEALGSYITEMVGLKEPPMLWLLPGTA
ncbi:hypothetical protein [Herbaspirillum huttiense]|uniref:Nucleic acid-binding protein n=1 Tax=Herbaspirillum huttiense subsp. lycopersici TaxID=3074428 RepID=A0ABU2EUH5_9BURK|nr:hypothetical protein [Herbaspirillum huttiense]MDR9851377.1 hypothetical protein [Herbaspirillum huttiense SE1]